MTFEALNPDTPEAIKYTGNHEKAINRSTLLQPQDLPVSLLLQVKDTVRTQYYQGHGKTHHLAVSTHHHRASLPHVLLPRWSKAE